MDFLVRPVKAGDLNFVFDSWMKSWRMSKWAGTIPNHLFYDTQRTLIEDLLTRGAKVVIAHPVGHDDVILGWACGEVKDETKVLHYVYVKDLSGDGALLRAGIQARLISQLPGSAPGFITHWLGKDYNAWRHVPEMARRKLL